MAECIARAVSSYFSDNQPQSALDSESMADTQTGESQYQDISSGLNNTTNSIIPRKDPSLATSSEAKTNVGKTSAPDHHSKSTLKNVVNFTTQDQISPEVYIFPDAIAALDAMGESCPDLILLDILLSGPNGFTLLNELASYSDTAQIPIIIITSLDLPSNHFSHYNVKFILNKSTMTPVTIQEAIHHAL